MLTTLLNINVGIKALLFFPTHTVLILHGSLALKSVLLCFISFIVYVHCI